MASHSARVQPPGTMVPPKTTEGKDLPVKENTVLVKGDSQVAESTSSTLGPNKIQDEKDMAAIKDGEIVYVTERSACKSMKFVELLEQFGSNSGFELMLALL